MINTHGLKVFTIINSYTKEVFIKDDINYKMK